MKKLPKTYFSFGKNFEKKFIKEMIKNPDIAMIELVSNSWDAKSTKVEINWPILDSFNYGETFSIKDNGTGMTKEEFEIKWTQLGFDKRDDIGNTIKITEDIERPVIGRNGKGRLGLFGFADKYIVITCKQGEISKFSVKKSNKQGEYAEIQEKDLNDEEKNLFDPINETGTFIKCHINDNYIEIEDLISTISTRFGANPYFQLYINNKKVNLLDLNIYDKKEYEYQKGKKIQIIQIPREIYNKRLSQYQVVWWVNQRAVENNTWKKMNIPLEANNSSHNKYLFCIIVDFLEPYVKSDWTGFESNQEVNNVKNFVKTKIMEIIKDYLKDSHYEKKLEVVRTTKKVLKNLNPVSQHEIGEFIDTLLTECSLDKENLSKIVSIVATMEKSNKKHILLEKLSEMDSDDLDKLAKILDKWSIEDAYTVLGELYWRLDIIANLEKLVNDPETDELHQIHPIFENGLWIFGSEYEGPGIFTSNKSLKTTLKEVLGIETSFKGDNKRPDIVTTPKGDVLDIYGKDELKNGKISGYEKILIIELKKGASTIKDKDMNQAKFYAKKIKAHGKIQGTSKIDCYVLGSNLDNESEEEETVGTTITIYPRTYDTIIREAKNITLGLMDKIKKVKGITDIGDPEINEIMKKEITQTPLTEY